MPAAPSSPDRDLELKEILIEVQPFSDSLKQWCRDHPDFTNALKIVYPEKFIALGAAVVTEPPHYPNDKVIGFYTYHYSLKNPKFKQDFIVDVGKRDRDFILYTRWPSSSTYIKDIDIFFDTYGQDGNYLRAHHVDLEDIPEEAKERALQAKALGDRIKQAGGFKTLDTEALVKANEDLRALRSNGDIEPVWKKINGARS